MVSRKFKVLITPQFAEQLKIEGFEVIIKADGFEVGGSLSFYFDEEDTFGRLYIAAFAAGTWLKVEEVR